MLLTRHQIQPSYFGWHSQVEFSSSKTTSGRRGFAVLELTLKTSPFPRSQYPGP